MDNTKYLKFDDGSIGIPISDTEYKILTPEEYQNYQIQNTVAPQEYSYEQEEMPYMPITQQELNAGAEVIGKDLSNNTSFVTVIGGDPDNYGLPTKYTKFPIVGAHNLIEVAPIEQESESGKQGNYKPQKPKLKKRKTPRPTPPKKKIVPPKKKITIGTKKPQPKQKVITPKPKNRSTTPRIVERPDTTLNVTRSRQVGRPVIITTDTRMPYAPQNRRSRFQFGGGTFGGAGSNGSW